MKKILFLFLMLVGLVGSLAAIDDHGRDGFVGFKSEIPTIGSDVAFITADAVVFGIKPDNPTSLIASGTDEIKNTLENSGVSHTVSKIRTVASTAVG